MAERVSAKKAGKREKPSISLTAGNATDAEEKRHDTAAPWNTARKARSAPAGCSVPAWGSTSGLGFPEAAFKPEGHNQTSRPEGMNTAPL